MNEVNYNAEGTLFNIQRYSIHDGPGIRTIPFLKAALYRVNGAVIQNRNGSNLS